MSLWEYLWAGSWITKGLYHLNGNSTDSSWNGNNGTDTDVSYVAWRFGQCASFNGSSAVIYRDWDSPVGITYDQFATAFTISCWIDETTQTALSVFTGMQVQSWTSRRRNMYLISNNGLIKINVFDGTANTYNTSLTTSTGIWYNIILTYDGTTIKIYWDGKLILSQARSLSYYSDSQAGWFGIWAERQNSTNNNYYAWLVDEVIVENIVWSAEKIKRYYTFSKGRFWIL